MSDKTMTSYRESHQGRGEDYHRRFTENPYRNLIWRFEKRFLARIVRSFPAQSAIRHLDFACGTGRVLAFLEPMVSSSTGVDVAESMLNVARASVEKARIIHDDITRSPILDEECFELITAFRFFPNCEPELRDAVMAKLVPLLASGGRLVFNNHLNLDSLYGRLVRFLKSGRPNRGMSRAEVQALLERHDLRIRQTFHVGVMPVTEDRILLPIPLLYCFEQIASRSRFLGGMAQDIVYVCERKER